MTKKMALNGGRQTTLDQFLKPVNSCQNDFDEYDDEFSDDDVFSSNSSSNDPSYVPTYCVRPRAHYKSVKTRKSSADAFFKKTVNERDSTKTIDGYFSSTDTNYSENENCMTNKKPVDDAGKLLDVPLVANSPPSDAEPSMPVTGSTPEVPSKHDSSACSSYSISNRRISSESRSTSSSKLDSHKRSNHHVTRTRARKLKCVGSTRKKHGRKGPYKEDFSQDSLTLPRVHTITIGDYELEPPYTSPLPLELVRKGHVYICEKCLDFKESMETLKRHVSKCWLDYPPGNEIFRQDDISVFEVDGNISKAYSQNLCLLAKLFIDHKTLFYDVEPFLFYVLTVSDSNGSHLAGYFSKQKCSSENNLSCLLTLPSYQSKGYGRFLIDFSFLLSRRQGTTGTPERPLSDLGNLAYRSYWRSVVLEYFKRPSSCTLAFLLLEDMAKTTGVAVNDLVQTMKDLEILHCDQKGDVKSFIVNKDLVEEHWTKAESDIRRIWIDEDNLKWEPKQYTLADCTSADDSNDS